MPSGDKKSKPIAIVTYPGVGLLDLVATKTVLDSLAMEIEGWRTGYRLSTLSM